MYAADVSTSITAVLATSSSFSYQGQLFYAWRDDSLYIEANDGDDYADIMYESSYAYEVRTINGAGENVTMAYAPFFKTFFPTQLSSSVDVTTWKVHYGVPSWTGLPAEAAGEHQAWVVGVQSISKMFRQPQNLADFPFDTQSISIPVEVAGLDYTAFQFVTAPHMTDIWDPLSTLTLSVVPEGFSVVGQSAVTYLANYTRTSTTPSGLSISYRLKRIPTFFVNRFVAPLTLVAIMMVSPLLLLISNTARLTLPFGVMGTVVSFVFVSSNSVPQLPYATRLDKFFLLCFFMVFTNFIYAIGIYQYTERFKKALEEAAKNAKAAAASPISTLSAASIAVASEPAKEAAAAKPDTPTAVAAYQKDCCGLVFRSPAFWLERLDIIWTALAYATYIIATSCIFYA